MDGYEIKELSGVEIPEVFSEVYPFDKDMEKAEKEPSA